VSKFHLIWCLVAQELSLGRNGQILGEVRVFQRPPAEHCMSQLNNVWPGQTMYDPVG
jgi:hypothetical protein